MDEFEGDRYRCALSPHLTLEEVVLVGREKERFIGGKVTVRKRDRHIYEAILVQEDKDYVPPARGVPMKEFMDVFNGIR